MTVKQRMVTDKMIQGCQREDRVAQQQLYQATAPYIYTVIRSYVYDDGYQKDVMQDAYAAIYASIRKFDSHKGSFKSWIARIATFKAVDFLKQNSKVKINTNLEVVDNLTEDYFNHLDQLSTNDIDLLLKRMPSGYRTIFMLSVIDEYSHKEIGELLDISAETSRSQLHRALKWIRKNLPFTSNQIRI